MPNLSDMLASNRVLLADGATGTAYFDRGLTAGDPPEMWNRDAPEKVVALHQEFVDAGSDIILTNSFGANRDRLKLHRLENDVFDLNKRAAELARRVADGADRPVLTAGSIGPLGELFAPLGALTPESAEEAFTEQANGLKAGGANLAWIETMSAVEEVQAAARGALAAGLDYCVTVSFDTAGKSMMGLAPSDLNSVFDVLEKRPLAFGANCGVGASDLLMSVLAMSAANPDARLIAKANCGIPVIKGDHVHYSGSPELMADYAVLAANAGATLIGGCCGTSPDHIRAMRSALDELDAGPRPDQALVEEKLGALAAPPSTSAPRERRSKRRRRSA